MDPQSIAMLDALTAGFPAVELMDGADARAGVDVSGDRCELRDAAVPRVRRRLVQYSRRHAVVLESVLTDRIFRTRSGRESERAADNDPDHCGPRPFVQPG
ncbi:hypothetical protein [Rhodococcus sp. IEGM 1379]|uniref:hypothetical protein n=1 Tax=Rhodococcus sp. IEGM 1379 TaxID=3047086 RepID=UPI0024B70528|nr:hypothetical protein [Rhodococcus sp. IEGM 1379]MDI9915122.1 hypothetical protein [Rhodococcus sp. IEGM 1379]